VTILDARDVEDDARREVAEQPHVPWKIGKDGAQGSQPETTAKADELPLKAFGHATVDGFHPTDER